MPFEIVRNDIVNMQVDAIVNPASAEPTVGWGCDTAIHQKAGPALLEARKAVGSIAVGDAKITGGFGLDARYVIHAVSPVWYGSVRDVQLLRSCYDSALSLAARYQCESIAFPLLAAGNHGFPKPLAMRTAIEAISSFLMEHEMQIYLVVFGGDAFHLSEQLFRSVESYIDEHYVQEKLFEEFAVAERDEESFAEKKLLRRQMQRRASICAAPAPNVLPMEAATAMAQPNLRNLLDDLDAGFSETLLKLIDQSGKKDSEIYKKANLSRQHFSKIRNNPLYKPTKETALALAVALELDLQQTRDLIGRAGYALSNSSKFDVIIMYFISGKNYNLFEINATLFEFDQSLLGA